MNTRTTQVQFDLLDIHFNVEVSYFWQSAEADCPAGWVFDEVESLTADLPDGSGDVTMRVTIEDRTEWLRFVKMKPSFSVGENKPWRTHELPSWRKDLEAAAKAAWEKDVETRQETYEMERGNSDE